jgi:hypothetical protein
MGAPFFFVSETLSRRDGTFDAQDDLAEPCSHPNKYSLVFGTVRAILVSNDASATATICRAVP